MVETIRLPVFRDAVKEVLPGAGNPLWTLGRCLLSWDDPASPRALDVALGGCRLELRGSVTDSGRLTLSRVTDGRPRVEPADTQVCNPLDALQLIVSAWWDGDAPDDPGHSLCTGWSGAYRRRNLWADDPADALGTARDLAEAACALLLAAAGLTGGTDVARFALGHLDRAAAAYVRALALPPHTGRLTNAGGADRPLAPGPPADATGCIAALEAAWGLGHPGVEMVRAGLQALLPASGPRGPAAPRLEFPVLLHSNARGGLRRTLTLESYPGPDGRLLCIPDPAALGCLDLAPTFLGAFAAAVESAREAFAGGACVRWRLDGLRGVPSLTGPSLGGAAAAGLRGLGEGRAFDASVALIAGVRPDGTLEPMRAGLPGKMAAAAAAGTRLFLVHPDDLPVVGDALTRAPGFRVLGVGHVRDALPHLTGVVDLVRDFLRRLAARGLARALVFRPESVLDDDLANFCLPVQVIDQRDWERAEARWRKARTGLGTPEDRDYITPWSEDFLRDNSQLRINMRPLEEVLDGGGHVILRGEPGEGKTTALWLHVARRCRSFSERLARGEIGPDHPDMLVPLVLPLSEAPELSEQEDLIELAKTWVLRLCYGGKAPPELVAWLDSRLRAGRFQLCLDALDEMVALDRTGARPCGATSRRQWLADQLLLCREVSVLLTARLTASDDGLLHRPQRLRMVCFGSRQVHEYIRRFFRLQPERGAELARRVTMAPGPRQLAQIPLLLAILCRRTDRSPTTPLPTTRTALLGLGLDMLLEWGDEKWRGVSREYPRDRRNEAKEAILRAVARAYYGSEPRPMPRSELTGLLEGQLWRFKRDVPEDGRALLREFLDDGVLVPRGDAQYGFVLRSFHEYCLAGWVALDCDPSALASAVAAAPPDRHPGGDLADGLRHLDDPEWQTIWPLICGRLAGPDNVVLAAAAARVPALLYDLELFEPALEPYEPSPQSYQFLDGSLEVLRHGKFLIQKSYYSYLEMISELPPGHPERTRFVRRISAIVRDVTTKDVLAEYDKEKGLSPSYSVALAVVGLARIGAADSCDVVISASSAMLDVLVTLLDERRALAAMSGKAAQDAREKAYDRSEFIMFPLRHCIAALGAFDTNRSLGAVVRNTRTCLGRYTASLDPRNPYGGCSYPYVKLLRSFLIALQTASCHGGLVDRALLRIAKSPGLPAYARTACLGALLNRHIKLARGDLIEIIRSVGNDDDLHSYNSEHDLAEVHFSKDTYQSNHDWTIGLLARLIVRAGPEAVAELVRLTDRVTLRDDRALRLTLVLLCLRLRQDGAVRDCLARHGILTADGQREGAAGQRFGRSIRDARDHRDGESR